MDVLLLQGENARLSTRDQDGRTEGRVLHRLRQRQDRSTSQERTEVRIASRKSVKRHPKTMFFATSFYLFQFLLPKAKLFRK